MLGIQAKAAASKRYVRAARTPQGERWTGCPAFAAGDGMTDRPETAELHPSDRWQPTGRRRGRGPIVDAWIDRRRRVERPAQDERIRRPVGPDLAEEIRRPLPPRRKPRCIAGSTRPRLPATSRPPSRSAPLLERLWEYRLIREQRPARDGGRLRRLEQESLGRADRRVQASCPGRAGAGTGRWRGSVYEAKSSRIGLWHGNVVPVNGSGVDHGTPLLRDAKLILLRFQPRGAGRWPQLHHTNIVPGASCVKAERRRGHGPLLASIAGPYIRGSRPGRSARFVSPRPTDPCPTR